jgi:hypothetical protein
MSLSIYMRLWVTEKRYRKLMNNYYYYWVQALFISRLDYCNSLLAGLPASTIKPSQHFQKTAAHLVFNLRKVFNVAPLLSDPN